MLLLVTVFLFEAVMGSLGFGLMGGGMKDVTGMDGASWEAKFHNADGQVCEFEDLDYTFMGLGALNCGWNGKDARLQKKIWSSDQSGCARACRKLQWCNYAWSDSGVTKLFNKGAGWCYMYNTCNERTGTEEGRLLKKKCPKTPTLPCISSCSTYKSQWTIDGDCDAGDCLGCDFYWKGNKFDNGACDQDEIDNAKEEEVASFANGPYVARCRRGRVWSEARKRCVRSFSEAEVASFATGPYVARCRRGRVWSEARKRCVRSFSEVAVGPFGDNDGGYKKRIKDHPVLVKRGVECQSSDKYIGKSMELEECALRVYYAGGDYLVYGTGPNAGWCYLERTSSESCPEGWEVDDYDFYKLTAITYDYGEELALAQESAVGEAEVASFASGPYVARCRRGRVWSEARKRCVRSFSETEEFTAMSKSNESVGISKVVQAFALIGFLASVYGAGCHYLKA